MKGKFLVRAKGTKGNDFIVSVIFKKEATHHNLVREAEGEEFKLNKVPTGCTTIPEVRRSFLWHVHCTLRTVQRA